MQKRSTHGRARGPSYRRWGARAGGGLVAVAGGMVLVGGDPKSGEELQAPELFDEASGQWFELPHQLAEPRNGTCVVSVPGAPAPAAQRTTQ